MPVDKAQSILRLVKIMEDILNTNPDFYLMNKNNQFSYHFRIVDDGGQDITKFSMGVKQGKVSINPKYEADVVIVFLESAFFDCIFNRQTIEEAYFAGEADIYAKKGNWVQHLTWIKSALDILEKKIRERLDKELG